MSSKKPFGEEARAFVRYCRDQGIATDRISTALIQLGFEARALGSALESELPPPAEGQDEMQALAAITMKMHTPGWRASLASARDAAFAAVAAVRERLPAGTRTYASSALAVSVAVVLLGWTTATWLIQAPAAHKRQVVAQAKANPAGTRIARADTRDKAAARRKKQFTFWALPNRD